MNCTINDKGTCLVCGDDDWSFFVDIKPHDRKGKSTHEKITICNACINHAHLVLSNNKKCPICKNIGFETTMYEQEGGYCWKCKTWVVNQSSAKDIYKIREYEHLLIQFHRNGKPTYTWQEWVSKMQGELE